MHSDGGEREASPMQDLSPVATPLVLIENVESGVVRLTLNRPQARNALSRLLIQDLQTQIEQLGQDPSVAAIVLAASGKVYSSGHDLKELTAHRTDADGGQAFFRATMEACSAMMRAIVACPKPIIAAVDGHATAAGCQLVATCDLAVAAETSDFATPGVNIGLFCSTPMVALSRNISRKRAMEMLLMGEALSASDAMAYGLVNRVVPASDVMTESLSMARTIASKSKATVAIGKAAFYRQAELCLDDAYAYASEVMTKNMMMADAGEGICAFIEKRKPEWEDR
jgi:enoyl-CoA hydratase/carnithine racemase